MEKRSRRRIRDLVALAASQGLSENEIGCARISMMARSINPPCKGRIQKRKTNHLQIVKSSLQRTAGPYKGATSGSGAARNHCVTLNDIGQSLLVKSRMTAMARSGASGIAGNKETVRTERGAEAAPQRCRGERASPYS